MASKLSPVGAEIDDQSMTLLRFADGKIGYVGSCWTSSGIYSLRVFGQKALMHYELDFNTWDTPYRLHETSSLYIQHGKDGYNKREVLKMPQGDMFQDELEIFAEACASGTLPELTARDGNIALAIVITKVGHTFDQDAGDIVIFADPGNGIAFHVDQFAILGELAPALRLEHGFFYGHQSLQPKTNAHLHRRLQVLGADH